MRTNNNKQQKKDNVPLYKQIAYAYEGLVKLYRIHIKKDLIIVRPNDVKLGNGVELLCFFSFLISVGVWLI